VTLTDQDARTRIAAGQDEALFVEAGAGTGKTTALVKRIVTLVRHGEQLPDVSRLAAITFTENAAAQLRQQLRVALQKAARSKDKAGERCHAALERLDDAAVTTLHGFAQRLLADLPLEAGLPPGFEVEDDVRAGLARDRWWDALVDEMFASEQLAPVWQTALTLGLRPDSLRPVAEAYTANWDQLPTGPLGPVSLPGWRTQEVLDALERVLVTYLPLAPKDNGLTTHLKEVLEPGLADARAEPDELGRAAVLAELPIASKAGVKGQWKQVEKAQVVAALAEVNELWVTQLDGVRSAVLHALLDRVRVAVLQDAEQRRTEGRLQFHDLLVRARDLLRDVPEARSALSQRWRLLLVDEFQDTDPLQAELVHLLAVSAPPDGWEQAVVDGGRLFFVGDPKQSIYRFRRADVQLYEQVQDRYGEQAQLRLTDNFRSRHGVLRAVNASFASLMTGAPEQVDYVDLAQVRERPARDPGPDVLLLGTAHEGVAVAELRPLEARHVASVIQRAKQQGWRVRDVVAEEARDLKDLEAPRVEIDRPVEYADIALLVPTRTSLGALEDALQEADVPYRVESRSLVWETDAVRDLLTLLEAVEDPGDQVAVVTALRHPGFACSDDDLVRWKAAHGSWSPFREPPPGLEDSPVAAGLAALRQYHDLRWWLPVNQLLDRIVRERHLVELTTALPRPRDHWRRLRFVVDQSRSFLDAGGSGLGAFVRWARQQAERGADAIESAVPEPDDDAVRILTIHASKGLESSVVVLTGINVDEVVRGPVSWALGRPEVKLKDFATGDWTTSRERDKVLDAAEAVRLLYVGMTRAMDHLVVSLHHKPTKASPKNHAARLTLLLEQLTAVGAVHEPDAPPATTAASTRPYVLPSRPTGDPQADFADNRKALLARVRAALPVSPSGLADSDPDDPVDPLEQVAPDPAPVRRPAVGGAVLGSLVHRALELTDFAQPSTAAAAVAIAAGELGAPELQAAAAARVAAALDSPLLQDAARRAHWKEVPVVAHLSGRYVEGFVDLVVQGDGGLVVVDYKTDAAPDDDARRAKVELYTPQLQAYAACVATATGITVNGAVLLFVAADSCVAEPVPLR